MLTDVNVAEMRPYFGRMFLYVNNLIFVVEYYSISEYYSVMVNLNEKVDELKKQYILQTAHEYFKNYGYEGTQIDKIAKELSIGVGTIYGYFKSKEGLFLAWLSTIIDEGYAKLIEDSKGLTDPKEKLSLCVDLKFRYFELNKSAIKGYMKNNLLSLKNISRGQEHPMIKVIKKMACYIAEIKPMSEDEAMLFAHIFDNIISTYIQFLSENDDFEKKKAEILKRFLCFMGVK